MYGLAAIVAPLLVTQVLILFADWRICFFIMSFGVLLLFIYLSLFVETKSKTETIEKKKTEKKPLSWAGWLAATSMSFYVGAEMIISTRIVLFLTREYDFSLSKASYYLTLFFVGLMAGRLLVAVRNWSISSWVLMALSLITSFAFFLMGFYLHPLGFAACGLSMSIFFPTMIAVISKNLNNESDRVIAVGMTGVAVVLIAMHWAFGLISDKWNMTTAMALGPVFLAIAFFSLFSFRKGVSHA